MTTGRMAERAGVSIGTLYQYFESIDALLGAILERQRGQMMRQLEAILSEIGGSIPTPQDALRAFIRQYVLAFAPPHPDHRNLIALALRVEPADSVVHSLREAGEKLAAHVQKLAHPGLHSLAPTQIFVLTRALMGIVKSAVVERSPLLESPDFEEQIFCMCWAVMARDPFPTN